MTKPADDLEDIDPGLARERTELAWTRTAISFAALGGAIMKTYPFVGLPILIMAALIWEVGRLSRSTGAGRARPRLMLLITVAIACVCVTALALALFGHPAVLRP